MAAAGDSKSRPQVDLDGLDHAIAFKVTTDTDQLAAAADAKSAAAAHGDAKSAAAASADAKSAASAAPNTTATIEQDLAKVQAKYEALLENGEYKGIKQYPGALFGPKGNLQSKTLLLFAGPSDEADLSSADPARDSFKKPNGTWLQTIQVLVTVLSKEEIKFDDYLRYDMLPHVVWKSEHKTKFTKNKDIALAKEMWQDYMKCLPHVNRVIVFGTANAWILSDMGGIFHKVKLAAKGRATKSKKVGNKHLIGNSEYGFPNHAVNVMKFGTVEYRFVNHPGRYAGDVEGTLAGWKAAFDKTAFVPKNGENLAASPSKPAPAALPKPAAASPAKPAAASPSKPTGASPAKPAAASPSKPTGASPAKPAAASPSKSTGASPAKPAAASATKPSDASASPAAASPAKSSTDVEGSDGKNGPVDE